MEALDGLTGRTGTRVVQQDAADEVFAALTGAAAVTGGATAANQTAQATLTGALTETTPGTDTASSGLNGRLQRISQRLTSLIALLPASIGQKTAAGSTSVVSIEKRAP